MKYYKADRNITLAPTLEELETITIGKSNFQSDEKGIFLQHGSAKIYLDLKDGDNAAQLMLNSQPTRISGREKETVLNSSKFYKVDVYPPFLGQFRIGTTIIGYFSRIPFRGDDDCLVTACHVLDYNRTGDIVMANGDKQIRLADLDVKIVAYSSPGEMDFVVMRCPSKVFSMLGLKVGKISPRAASGSPISIYQHRVVVKENLKAVSTGCISKDNRPWFIQHGASTFPGVSGSPVLDMRSHIVGIHVEGGESVVNYAVIPPFFRTSNAKETAAKTDIVEEDEASLGGEDGGRGEGWHEQEGESDEGGDAYAEEEANDAYYSFVMERANQKFERAKGKSWAEQMDDADAVVEGEVDDDEKEEFVKNYLTYRARTNRSGWRKVKKGRYVKESPWSCVACGHLHLHHAVSCSLCGKPVIPHDVAVVTASAVSAHLDRIAARGNLTTEEKLEPSAPSLPPEMVYEIKAHMDKIIEEAKHHWIVEQGFNHKPFECIKDHFEGDVLRFAKMEQSMAALDTKFLTMDLKLAELLRLNAKEHTAEKNQHGIPGVMRLKKDRKTGQETLVVDQKLGINPQTGDSKLVPALPLLSMPVKVIKTKEEEAKAAKNKARRLKRKEKKKDEVKTKETVATLNSIAPLVGGIISSGNHQ